MSSISSSIAIIKYCFYFHRLLFYLSIALLYLKYNNQNVPEKILLLIDRDIKQSGFVTIKFIQWTLSRYKNFKSVTYKENPVYRFLNNFSDVYENCNIHSIQHTDKLFRQDFDAVFSREITLDQTFNIRSGSIAQVYKGTLLATGETVAVKVIHPELQEQSICPYLYYRLYRYLTETQQLITWLHRFRFPFDMSSFFDNFSRQTDMIHEAKNLEFFYNHYRENPVIVIPKPILSSRNILIMEYIDGEQFESLSISQSCNQYTQYKIISILNLFVRNNLIILSKNHADLHSSNWKVIQNIDANAESKIQIVVYDFGFCLDIQPEYRETLRHLCQAVETNDHEQFVELLFNYITSKQGSKMPDKTRYLQDCRDTLIHGKTSVTLFTFIEFCTNKGYTFRSDILDLLLSQFLANNYFKNFTSSSNVEEDFERYDENHEERLYKLLQTNNQIINLSSICESNNTFHELNKYFRDFIESTRKEIRRIKLISTRIEQDNQRIQNKEKQEHDHEHDHDQDYIDI